MPNLLDALTPLAMTFCLVATAIACVCGGVALFHGIRRNKPRLYAWSVYFLVAAAVLVLSLWFMDYANSRGLLILPGNPWQ